MWNKISMVLKYTGISRRWNSPVFALPHLPFLFCNCFLSLGGYLVIVGFGCLVREMRLWEKRSLKTKKKKKKRNSETGGMAFSACVILANSQGQFLQAKVDLSQCPHGAPCAFHWELVFSRHLSVIQLKSPHHEKKKTLKARIWDLPVTRGLWCISTSAAPSHAVVSLFFVSMCSVPHCRIRFLTFPQYLKSSFDATLLR